MPQPTELPFPAALKELLEESGWSARELERQTERAGNRKSHSSVNQWLRGQQEVSVESMEVVAAVFHLAPTYFAEYRLALARKRLDPRTAGLDQALSYLDEAGGSLAAED
jgi:transcriptional regulator with XRE-family HTH domain